MAFLVINDRIHNHDNHYTILFQYRYLISSKILILILILILKIFSKILCTSVF